MEGTVFYNESKKRKEVIEMTFAEKLKALRRQTGMSQEKLAETLGVSRQAITKWETDAGIPDIENLMALSALFQISIDELLSREPVRKEQPDYLFESVTEYDVDGPKHYDMNFGRAKTLVVSGYDGEKIRVRLVSDTLETLQSDLKLKIDDVKNRMDLDLSRRNGLTEEQAKEALTILVQLPNPYLGKVELQTSAETVELRALTCDSIELGLKTRNVVLEQVAGTVEIDCNLDMRIVCRSLCGAVEINQLSATSRIFVPEGTPFTAITKGRKTRISYEKDGRPAEPFGVEDAGNVIELNGIKSELVICTGEAAEA